MRIISMEALKAERRKQTVETDVSYVVSASGRPETRTVKKRIVNGEMEVFDLSRPIGEMITTPQGLESLIQKSVIDLELGREAVPLLYGPVYRKIEDANFTEHVDITPFVRCRVVFLQHMELQEIQFGDKRIGPKDTVPIITWAGGFEWTEDMEIYDKTWERAETDRAMGEAYNALLNHIHLNPILSFNYAAKNKTPADAAGATLLERMRTTIRNGLQHAGADKNTDTGARRRPNILLAHSSRSMDIQEALQRMQIGGTIYPALSQVDTLIFYDGWSVTVGEKTYEYPGCDPTKGYLIEGQKYFRELVKHDLRVDASAADLSRLVMSQVVGRARRGVIASPANAVEELTLPA